MCVESASREGRWELFLQSGSSSTPLTTIPLYSLAGLLLPAHREKMYPLWGPQPCRHRLKWAPRKGSSLSRWNLIPGHMTRSKLDFSPQLPSLQAPLCSVQTMTAMVLLPKKGKCFWKWAFWFFQLEGKQMRGKGDQDPPKPVMPNSRWSQSLFSRPVYVLLHARVVFTGSYDWIWWLLSHPPFFL